MGAAHSTFVQYHGYQTHLKRTDMQPENSEGFSTGVKTPEVSLGSGSKHRRRVRRRRARDAWEVDQVCKKCDGGTLSRVHRETMLEFLLSGFGCYPFTCGNCHQRSTRIDPARLAGGVCVSILACAFLLVAISDLHSLYLQREQSQKAIQLGLPAPSVAPSSLPYRYAPVPRASASHTGALTNGDIVDMVKGGMSDNFIRNLIREVGNKFIVDSQSLVELKNQHVPESVILSMVEAAKQNDDRVRADTASNAPGN